MYKILRAFKFLDYVVNFSLNKTTFLLQVIVMGHHHIPLARSSPPQSYSLVPPVFVDPFLATPPTSTLSYPVPPSHPSNDGGFILALVLLVLILVALFV